MENTLEKYIKKNISRRVVVSYSPIITHKFAALSTQKQKTTHSKFLSHCGSIYNRMQLYIHMYNIRLLISYQIFSIASFDNINSTINHPIQTDNKQPYL